MGVNGNCLLGCRLLLDGEKLWAHANVHGLLRFKSEEVLPLVPLLPIGVDASPDPLDSLYVVDRYAIVNTCLRCSLWAL